MFWGVFGEFFAPWFYRAGWSRVTASGREATASDEAEATMERSVQFPLISTLR